LASALGLTREIPDHEIVRMNVVTGVDGIIGEADDLSIFPDWGAWGKLAQGKFVSRGYQLGQGQSADRRFEFEPGGEGSASDGDIVARTEDKGNFLEVVHGGR
jgi:hypothetical protein